MSFGFKYGASPTNFYFDVTFLPNPARISGKQLFDELKQQGDPRILGNGRIFDQYAYGKASMRNHHDRIVRGETIIKEKATD